eukprot:COSAG02_NODE_1372_length_13018_cov_5.358155_3_plen_60_part_00
MNQSIHVTLYERIDHFLVNTRANGVGPLAEIGNGFSVAPRDRFSHCESQAGSGFNPHNA